MSTIIRLEEVHMCNNLYQKEKIEKNMKNVEVFVTFFGSHKGFLKCSVLQTIWTVNRIMTDIKSQSIHHHLFVPTV